MVSGVTSVLNVINWSEWEKICIYHAQGNDRTWDYIVKVFSSLKMKKIYMRGVKIRKLNVNSLITVPGTAASEI